jgi:hypothetical protein
LIAINIECLTGNSRVPGQSNKTRNYLFNASGSDSENFFALLESGAVTKNLEHSGLFSWRALPSTVRIFVVFRFDLSDFQFDGR